MNLSSKRLIRVLVPLFAAVVLLPGAPARAAEISFPDPEGDATGLVVDGLPRESDPELDILSVTFSSDADSLSAVVKLVALGTPQLATGATRTASFTYEGATYSFRFQAPSAPANEISGTGFYFRKGSTTIPCGRCSGRMDPKTNSVIFDAEFKSMSSGMKSEDASVAPIGPGSKITGLAADTYRTVLLSALAADSAEPPGEVEFTL